jgi:tripartite-type tricarboxylate transporter receptor subunit TctC
MTVAPRIAVAAALLATAAAPAFAQGWPQRPVRIVTHASAGTWDTYARLITPRLGDVLGRQVLVDNKVGANGNIAMVDVAKAAADGHTILFGATGALAINAAIYDQMPVDPQRDFDAVALAATVPMIWTATAAARGGTIRSLGEYVQQAKSAPGKLSFGLAANGSLNHLVFEGMKQRHGLDIVAIAYKSTPPAQQDVIGGAVPVMVDSVGAAIGHVRAGNLAALAVTTRVRAAALPDTPTVIELGLDDREYTGWYGFLAPRGTPPDIVARLNAEIVKALQAPEVAEKIRNLGATPATMTPDQFRQFLQDERAKWGAIAKAGNVRLQ